MHQPSGLFEAHRAAARFATARPEPLTLDSLSLTRADYAAGPACLPPVAATAREKVAWVLFLITGAATLEQLGNRVSLAPGDVTLCDGHAPHAFHVTEPSQLLLLCVPMRRLGEHLPSPEWFCARHLPGEGGISAPIVALIDALLENGHALPAGHRPRISRHLLDLVATCYAIGFDAEESTSSIVIGRRAAIKLYIEQHLRDPELTPCSIAQRLRLSSRYLRLIFAAGNETVSAYILRRRLEECARQIADPRWRGHSMTEIAFAWGFNSAPHFTRSFRERFATAPRDYRRQQLEALAA